VMLLHKHFPDSFVITLLPMYLFINWN